MADDEAGKKATRSPRVPGQGRRPTITFRCRADLQASLQQAAQDGDRSLSEEIERRLESSFHNQELVDLVTEAARANGIAMWRSFYSNSVGGEINSQAGYQFAHILHDLQLNSDNLGGDRNWTRDRVKALVEEKGASEMIPALLARFPFPTDASPHPEEVRREEERERTRKLHEQNAMQTAQK